MTLERRKLRGEGSEGMILAEDEVDLGTDHDPRRGPRSTSFELEAIGNNALHNRRRTGGRRR